MKVIRMVTTYGNNPVSESYKMKKLYEAAGSVFALPDYKRFLYLTNAAEPPYCGEDTPALLLSGE